MQLAYKYRSGDLDTFKRDLKFIQDNCVWFSSINELNDPAEGIFDDSSILGEGKKLSEVMSLFGYDINTQLDKFHNAWEVLRKAIQNDGIYSLSKTYKDELMWAHYGNSHRGFCIEYDLEKFFEGFIGDSNSTIPVTYSKTPPRLDLSDAENSNHIIMQKTIGHKSLRWAEEDELRIVSSRVGKVEYNYEALIGICFGIRTDKLLIDEVMHSLEGRGLKYYQMELIPHSYKLERRQLSDPYTHGLTYLTQLRLEDKVLEYKITKKNYWIIPKMAEMTIELQEVLTEDLVEKICTYMKRSLYPQSESLTINFQLYNSEDYDIWATAIYNSDFKIDFFS